MAGMTIDELCLLAANHMRLVKGGIADVDEAFTVANFPSGTEIDKKNQVEPVKSMMRAAIGSWFASVARSPQRDAIWALCRKSKGLQVNADGYYTMGQGNPYSVANTYDGEELSLSADADGKVDGHIVTVEVTYDTPAAAPGSGLANPFPASASWKYAEPDSAAAIRRYRALKAASILLVPLYSAEVSGRDIHTGGTGLRVVYVPSDFGDVAGETVPREYANPILAEFLSMMYGEGGANSGIGAAQYYANKVQAYRQELFSTPPQFVPLPPYQGT
jgi:hypothetical protein